MSSEDHSPAATIRRVLFALDAMNCQTALIDAATRIAAKLDADLDALFVEDPDMHAVALLPFTREISRSSAQAREISGDRVAQALRALSRDAEARFSASVRKNRVRGNFSVAHARREDALVDALQRTPLLLLQPGVHTLLRIRLDPAPARIHAICGNTVASTHTLELAARLAGQDHRQLELVLAGSIDAAQVAAIEGRGIRVNRHASAPDTPIIELLRQVENRLGNTLVIAADLPAGADRAQLLRELAQLRCQVLLVNS